jgi:hypothetical protein
LREFTDSLEEKPGFIYWVQDFPTLNTEAAGSPKKSENFYYTSQCNIP